MDNQQTFETYMNIGKKIAEVGLLMNSGNLKWWQLEEYRIQVLELRVQLNQLSDTINMMTFK